MPCAFVFSIFSWVPWNLSSHPDIFQTKLLSVTPFITILNDSVNWESAKIISKPHAQGYKEIANAKVPAISFESSGGDTLQHSL